MMVDTDARETDLRDRWPRGLVRHLRLDPAVAPGMVWAICVQYDGGISAGGSRDVYYTLVVNPAEEEIERLRALAEADPNIGGLFSPPRDIPS